MTSIEIVENDEHGSPLTAEKFLELVRRSHPQWWEGGGATTPWIFRGQWNADWPLLPRAWRKLEDNPLAPLIELCRTFQCETSRDVEIDDREVELRAWNCAEKEAVSRFIQLADEVGINTPQSHEYGAFKAKRLPSVEERHAPQDAALAQHHGIPTRLIDWTESSVTAAYFAAAHQYRSGNSPSHLAVFALNCDALNLQNQQTHSFDHPYAGEQRRPPGVFTVKYPKTANPYMQAQRGMFTVAGYFRLFYRINNRLPSVEEIIRFRSSISDYEGCVLKIIKLRVELADRLLLILDREGINEALLMPSLDRVAATVIQRIKFL